MKPIYAIALSLTESCMYILVLAGLISNRGHAMAHMVGQQPLITRTRLNPRPVNVVFVVDKLVFTCPCHSTNFLHPFNSSSVTDTT